MAAVAAAGGIPSYEQRGWWDYEADPDAAMHFDESDLIDVPEPEPSEPDQAEPAPASSDSDSANEPDPPAPQSPEPAEPDPPAPDPAPAVPDPAPTPLALPEVGGDLTLDLGIERPQAEPDSTPADRPQQTMATPGLDVTAFLDLMRPADSGAGSNELLNRLDAGSSGGAAPDSPTRREGITRVTVSPLFPTDEDTVLATVTGWKPAANYELERTEIHIAGGEIRLDCYWHAPEAGAQVLTAYEHTVSLGRLAAGTYTLKVVNHGMVGTGSASFAVTRRGPSVELSLPPRATDIDPGAGLLDAGAQVPALWDKLRASQ
jgi:hypothetical protein